MFLFTRQGGGSRRYSCRFRYGKFRGPRLLRVTPRSSNPPGGDPGGQEGGFRVSGVTSEVGRRPSELR